MANILLFDSLFNLTLDISLFLSGVLAHTSYDACMQARAHFLYTVRFVRSCNEHSEQFAFQYWWNSNSAKYYNTNNSLCRVCKQKLFVRCTLAIVHVAHTLCCTDSFLNHFSSLPDVCSFWNTFHLNCIVFCSHCSRVRYNSGRLLLHIFGVSALIIMEKNLRQNN